MHIQNFAFFSIPPRVLIIKLLSVVTLKNMRANE